MYRVLLTKRAVKGLDSAPEHVSKRASQALEALQESFAPVKSFDVKKLGYGRHFQDKIRRLEINL